MELEKLRIFCAAAERGSFTGAAAELYISHSTVSRAVAELERELGAELFRRARRGVEPTAAGRRCSQARGRCSPTPTPCARTSGNGRKDMRKKTMLRLCALLLAAVFALGAAPAVASYAPSFSDVPAGEWYADYVSLCAGYGIINGYEDAPSARRRRSPARSS